MAIAARVRPAIRSRGKLPTRYEASERNNGQDAFPDTFCAIDPWSPCWSPCRSTNRMRGDSRLLGKLQRSSHCTRQPLLDHLVGALLDRHRNLEAECLGGLEIDDKLIFDRHLHRQIGWFLALEDTVDIGRSAAKQVDKIGAIGHQSATYRKQPVSIDRRQAKLRR